MPDARPLADFQKRFQISSLSWRCRPSRGRACSGQCNRETSKASRTPSSLRAKRLSEYPFTSRELPVAAREVMDRFVDLDRLVSEADYRGYEFDDFLGSPILRALSFDNLLLKRIFIQAGERLPWNLRPLLGVRKLPSTKANGFFARAYLHAHQATGEPQWLEKGAALLHWLIENASPDYSGPAWGNAFDFASRGGFIPKGEPTIVWTSHIGEAFLVGYSITGDRRYGDVVVGIGDFVLDDLPRHEDDRGVCLAYTPTQFSPVHNANLLGAVALLRGWSLDDDGRKLDVAQRAFAWSLQHMNVDGSWFYGVGEKYAWIDNFHTAYVIDCLLEGHALAGEGLVPQDALDRTIAFWVENFFESDGAPRYYRERLYPLDSQCTAQAIETFARLSDLDPALLDRAYGILSWATTNFRRRDGFYLYRKGRFFTNRLVSIHWGQATMLAALGALLYHEPQNRDACER